MKKLRMLLIPIFIMLLAAPVAFAGEAAAAASISDNDAIVIIATNDVHCNYLAYDKVATLAKDADLLVDSGDFLQGSLIGALSEGAYVIEIMNYLGYDVAEPGNHDFDFGIPRMNEIIEKEAQFPFVCCNLRKKDTQQDFFAPYKIMEVKGKKIAFVGVITPQTLTSAKKFQNESGEYLYSFFEGANGQELYTQVQHTVDAARAEGADYVIVLAHLGTEEASSPWRAADLIQNVSGIDVLADAHSHSTYTDTIGTTKVFQSGTGLKTAGKITIQKNGDISVENVDLSAIPADAETTAFLKTITDKVETVQKQVIAKTTVELTTKNPDGTRAIRSKETNLGDLCSDAFRSVLGADIAFINGGGIRADIPSGNITTGNLISVFPFSNKACLAEVSGQQILDALELSAASLPGEFGGFLQVSGITFTIDTSIPSSVVRDEHSDFVEVAGERRVKNVLVDGKAIEPDKKYTLASYDYFLKSAGDGFAMFGTKNIKLLQDSVKLDNQVLIEYITDTLGGVIGKEYEYSQGRITILPAGTAAGTAMDSEQKNADSSAVPQTQKSDSTPEAASAPAAAETYRVQKGDSLWRIAMEHYGKGQLWTVIYNANKDTIKNPNRIRENQIITLPKAA